MTQVTLEEPDVNASFELPEVQARGRSKSERDPPGGAGGWGACAAAGQPAPRPGSRDRASRRSRPWRLEFGQEGMGEWRLIRADCNRMPAAISYLRRPGDGEFRIFKIDVIRAQGGKVREVTTLDATLREAFGVPGGAPWVKRRGRAGDSSSPATPPSVRACGG
jgi:hypothetical protein